MASGLIGTPISVETLLATGEYKEPITQKDVADYAMTMINAYDIRAQEFVDNLNHRHGGGISAKCLIYNATGTTLSFVTYNDWHGHINETPSPSYIQNGQWGAFLHVHPSILGIPTGGSAGAVVYRSKVPSSSSLCDWLFSWSIPLVGGIDRVYTEIGEEDYFPKHWDDIHAQLVNSRRSFINNGYGYVSRIDIGEGNTVNARAVCQLPN